MLAKRLIHLGLLGFGSTLALDAQATDWMQFGFDQAHTGNNPVERGYPVASVNAPQWQLSLHEFGLLTNHNSDSTPIFLSKVVTASGTKDLLYIVTTDGILIAIDAANGNVIWSKHPAGSNITNGSPAIDPNRNFIYAYGLDGFVHKYKVGDGTEITASTSGASPVQLWPAESTKKPNVDKGAAGLAFSTPPGGVNYLYAAMDGYGGDNGDYQGHLTTIVIGGANDGHQNIFNAQCSNLFIHFKDKGTAGTDDCDLAGVNSNKADGQMAGIWGRPGAVYDASTDRVYVATGNGQFAVDPPNKIFNWGDSLLALNKDGTGSGTAGLPVDSFTPSQYANLYATDADLGSTSPAILPSSSALYPHLAVQSGKDGCVRLINLSRMGSAAGAGTNGGEINSATSCTGDSVGGQVRTQPAVWVNPADGSTNFFIATDAKIVDFKVNVAGDGSLTLSKPWTQTNRGTSPVIANNVLYYVSNSGNPNTLRALDAASGTQLWSASVGSIHWQSPIVVNGHVYLADGGNQLYAFSLDGIFKTGFN